MLARFIFLGAAILGLGACATETRVVVAADDPCTLYGFRAGTVEYNNCRAREVAARQQGRVVVGYSDAQVMADAQAACRSYGLAASGAGYDRCVQQEYAARRPL